VVDEQPGKIPIWSSSGVTAGLDAFLAFAKKWYSEDAVQEVANIIEYEDHKDAAYDPFSKIWKVPTASTRDHGVNNRANDPVRRI